MNKIIHTYNGGTLVHIEKVTRPDKKIFMQNNFIKEFKEHIELKKCQKILY